MSTHWIFWSIVILPSFLVVAVSADDSMTSTGTAERQFVLYVWPILQSKCLPCHGDTKKLEGGLDLRSRETALRGGESGQPALVPGKKEASSVWRAITRRDPDFSAMPPKENDRLSDQQLRWIEQWLVDGAPWPDEARRRALAAELAPHETANAIQVATSGGLGSDWTNRRYKPQDLWAYQPIRKPLPPVGDSATHPIDAFLAPRLVELSLPAATPANRLVLIRRATFDVLGLPPTTEEIEAYLGDLSSEEMAFAALVDRLLASPRYGEHWGRHWLDVVRYADSSGFANDYERGNAWRYRDYVVRALNDDKPYDQFIREQIAGDELDDKNAEMLVATGFLRMGPWELTGMEVAKVARQRFLDDVTDAVGQVFLAHPLQCARCHDHKFDPVPTRDYYKIQACFATTQLAERPAPFLPLENTRGFEEREYLVQRQRHFESLLDALDKKEEAAARQWCADRNLEYVPRNQGLRQGIPEEKLPPKHAGFSVEDYGIERIARKGLERLRWELDRYEPVALSVFSGPTPVMKSVNAPLRMPPNPMALGQVERTAVLAGGDPFSPTFEVTPGALSTLNQFLPANRRSLPTAITDSVVGRRRELADWIAHSDNPLTARVMANRIWQGHFGQALAGNPNNFGTTGKKPSHPQLLDWLAATLIEQGWSLKALHRTVMMSEAYRRRSEHPQPDLLAEKDPQGVSYAVFRPRRLTAEELCDSLLAVSGELNLALGGIPVRPEINREVALQPRQVMGTFASAWQPAPRPEQRHRRSLYSLRIRGMRDPFAEVFNEPSPDVSCEARESSTVTPQVFSLFNSELSYDRALAFAARLQRETMGGAAAIDRAFQLAFGRRPSDTERTACLAHWSSMTRRHEQLRFENKRPSTEVVREAVEENTGEKFQFSEQLESARDFVADLKFAEAPAETRGLAELCLVIFNSNEFAYVY